MIVEVIDKLIDRCIQLVKHKEEVHRRLFDDFITPIHLDFEVVHQDYLDTFRKYREMVKTSKPPLDQNHSVLDAINEDAIFNAKLRLRIHGALSEVNDPLLGDFIQAIAIYFHWVTLSADDLIGDGSCLVASGASNAPRHETFESISTIFRSSDKTEAKRSKAIETIDGVVAKIQGRYAKETKEYSNLKKNLLASM